MDNKIDQKSIGELFGMNFYIPDYQRGYRWSIQQVKDLLDDIQDFIDKKKDGFYCIQPLVVRKREQDMLEEIKMAETITDVKRILKGSWEVIDGQQRLTTIYILISYLQKYEDKYSLEYETRLGSQRFLKNIFASSGKSEDAKNIDYFHMLEAKEKIECWFDGRSEKLKENFLSTLQDNVKFIWYESVDENPISVFTRLNIGKINLTNAELIKALFLNKDSFKSSDYYRVRLIQQQIAGEWDNIESTLQNDEFWLFINPITYTLSTRIDFIFDLIKEKNLLGLGEDDMKALGDDTYQTFRYFYIRFRNVAGSELLDYWREVKKIFLILQEWFNDLHFYHYVGFLIECGCSLTDIIAEWSKSNVTKDSFINDYIKVEIRKKLSNCSDLDKQYEVSGSPKTQSRPLLLLHNIQTIIDQNQTLIENDRYKLPVFYKFPFHLFKEEQWDVEHIDSHVDNSLEDIESQKIWLKTSLIGLNDQELIERIELFCLTDSNNEEVSTFDQLRDAIIGNDDGRLEENEKDKVWNFTLLDASTNRSYGNSIFPVKRRVIIGKDQGKKFTINENFTISEKDGGIAFIPPVTRNVFMKYYNTSPTNMREWREEDASPYKKSMRGVLDVFFNDK